MNGNTPVRPVTALGLVELSLQRTVLETFEPFNVRIEMSDTADLVVARIESGCPQILLLDTELMGRPADLCCFARGLRPDLIVLAVAYFWSEREEALRECADAVLHKPPRQAEWHMTLRRLQVPESAKRTPLPVYAA